MLQPTITAVLCAADLIAPPLPRRQEQAQQQQQPQQQQQQLQFTADAYSTVGMRQRRSVAPAADEWPEWIMVFGLPREAVPELFRVFEAFGQVRCCYHSIISMHAVYRSTCSILVNRGW
jgi:hypothetical protein